ncbi:hypothetical protein IFM89_013695 [Coptis chinensis]|uniref:Uncharacterized protein n=1 Tax=Coptis chinensis TaxID=261450 RepID=A0A835LAW6_9MAGN|nr:hypothetical protein IFM89_013695 [Coptis chinensis]
MERPERNPPVCCALGAYLDKLSGYDEVLCRGGDDTPVKSGTLEVPKRSSPMTAQNARQLKMTGLEFDPPVGRTLKERSPKVIVRRSPRSPVSEVQKKRPGRMSELESQLAQLQEDLKKAKDQLGLSESWKRHAQQEADEAKRQLIGMKAKLEESEHQLFELSASDDARIQELRKISQERDRAWESELDAVRNQYSVDSATVVSAMNEIQRLKLQLEMVAELEATQTKHAEAALAELQILKQEHDETLSLVDDIKLQLRDCIESEDRAKTLAREILLQLEATKTNVETLQCNDHEAIKAYSYAVSELQQSGEEVISLEELLCKLKQDLVHAGSNRLEDLSQNNKIPHEIGEIGVLEEVNLLKAELESTKLEVKRVKSALEIAEIKYQEEQIRSTMHIRSAYELAEQRKSESTLREAEFNIALKKTKDDMDELKTKLRDREIESEGILQENKELCQKIEKSLPSERASDLEMEVEKLKANVGELKADLMDKETELQCISEENEMLKSEIKDKEIEQTKSNIEDIIEGNADQEALMRLANGNGEADKISKREAWIIEQLEAAQATNKKMEVELSRVKVQADQWRKAAEAAAAILSTEDNEKIVERSAALDTRYDLFTGKMGSPFPEGMDDELLKKKNNNVLKKIGDLWKKGPK